MAEPDEILNNALDRLQVPNDERKGFDARYDGDALSIRIPGGKRIIFPATVRVERGGIVEAVVRELLQRGIGIPRAPGDSG